MLYQLNEAVSAFVWGPPMLAVFLGVGLFLTVRSGFFQFTHIRLWIKSTVCTLFGKKSEARQADSTSISQVQALCAALAACMGTGNIVGVATAITAGGPGAVFWMWISAILGMMTGAVENILGIRYRYRDAQGEWMGGAMVYLEKGLGLQKTAKIFCFFLVLASFGIGNMTQANSIAASMQDAFAVPPVLTAAVVAALVGVVVLGGIKRIAAVAERLIPAVSVVFILAAFVVIGANAKAVPGVLRLILREAFSLQAAGGAAAGYGIKKAMRYGIARGVFSNEAGLGSSAIIHCAAQVDRPATQGMWGILEICLDTIVMCTVTAFTILCSGVWTPGGALDGAQLSAAAFSQVFGRFGSLFVCICVSVFAFATLIGWSYYGKRGAQYLFGTRAQRPYLLVYVAAAFLGCIARLDLVWSLSDTLNGLMAIPNLLGILLLSGEAMRELRSYRHDNPLQRRARAITADTPASRRSGRSR